MIKLLKKGRAKHPGFIEDGKVYSCIPLIRPLMGPRKKNVGK